MKELGIAMILFLGYYTNLDLFPKYVSSWQLLGESDLMAV